MKKTKRQWERVGEIGIDSGVCWLGDPSYVLPGLDAEERLSWRHFLEGDRTAGHPAVHQWEYRPGRPGLGVSVRTGYGDGRYDVFVKEDEEGYVAAVKIVFIDDTESDVEEEAE